jgi:hypothetical protein
MAAIIDEILGIEAFIKSVVPGAIVEKQTVPLQPAPGLFVARFLTESRTDETAYHYRIERDYQVIYYSATPQAAFPVMDALSNAIYDVQRIVATGSRLNALNYSQPMRTDTDKAATTNAGYATLGILRITSRQSRTQQSYPLIQNVNSRFN